MFEQSMALFIKGGIVMIPIFAAAVLTVAIGMERFIIYHRASSDVMPLWLQVKKLITQEEYEQAVRQCALSTNIAAPVLAKALACLTNRQIHHLREVIEGEVAAQVAVLRKRLSYLSTAVTITPLLGLLGTVIGMIKTFNVLSLSAGQPGMITGGVGEALIATAAGLCVAIVAALFHSYFTERLEDMITSLEIIANGMIELTGRCDK